MLARNGIREEADPEFIDAMRVLLREVAKVERLSALGWYSFYADIEGQAAQPDPRPPHHRRQP